MTGPRAWARIIKARGQLIITDEDLTELVEASVDVINKAVFRNACMFPRSICFRLSAQEWHSIKNKITHQDIDRGHWLTSPLAFTAEGVLALSKALDTFESTRASVIVWRAVRGLETASTGN